MRPLSPSTPASSGNARREEQLHFLLWFRSPELEQEFVKTRVREGRFFMTSFLVMVLGSLLLAVLSVARVELNPTDSGPYSLPFFGLAAVSVVYLCIVRTKVAEQWWQPLMSAYALCCVSALIVASKLLPDRGEKHIGASAFYAGVIACAGPALAQMWMLSLVSYTFVLLCFLAAYWSFGVAPPGSESVVDTPIALMIFGAVMMAKTRRDEASARLEFLRVRRLRERGEDVRIKVGQFNVSDLGAWLAGNRSSSNDPSSASTDVPPSQLPLVHYDSMEQPATGPLGVDAEDPRRSRRGNHSDTGSFRAPTLTAGGAGSAVERPSAVPPLQPSRSAYGSLLHSQSSRRARLPLATSIRSQLTTRSHEAGTLLTSLFNTTEATMAQMVRTESHGDESRTSFSADDEHQDAQAPGYLRLWVINRAALHQRRKIASGGSGQVWEGRYNRTRVAIKELFSALMDPEALEEFVQEASLQSQLRHPNIGVFLFYGIGASNHGGVPALVTEYCPVTLTGLLEEVGRRQASEGRDTLPIARQGASSRRSSPAYDAALLLELAASFDPYVVALDVAFGMQYLHERDVIHQDLKVENVLMDAHGNAKICDFGISQLVGARESAGEVTATAGVVTGTPEYMAPELWAGVTHAPSKKVDVFAFGILLQRLFTEGEDPYQQFLGAQDRVARIREFVVSGQRPGPDPRVPHAVRRLVLECLQDAPRSRPSFVDIARRIIDLRKAVDRPSMPDSPHAAPSS